MAQMLHPRFPDVVRMVVEQPRDARYRVRYDRERRSFYETAVPSLIYDANFPGVYGWVEGLGAPPGSHCDIFLITDCPRTPGDVAEAHVCGVLVRNDRDHKLVSLDVDWAQRLSSCDLAALPLALLAAVMRLYPVLRPGERWGGVGDARSLLISISNQWFIPNAD